MVKASEIKDEETLKAWLKDQPREVAVQIAARAALRVMPFWIDFAARKWGATSTPVLLALRAGMICNNLHRHSPIGLEGFTLILTAQLQGAANFDGDVAKMISAHRDGTVAESISSYSVFGASLALSIAYATRSELKTRVIASLVNQMHRAFKHEEMEAISPLGNVKIQVLSRETFWMEVQRDAAHADRGSDMMNLSLFKEPRTGFDFWVLVRQRKFEKEDWFGFWFDWYSSLLIGNQLVAREIQDEIAMRPDEFWERAEDIASDIDWILDTDSRFVGEASGLIGATSASGNSRVIEQQLKTLLTYLQQQKQRLGGLNSLPESQLERKESLLSLFDDMIARVEAMLREFENGIASENALVVVQEQVPAILEEAAKVEDAGGGEETPAYIANFASTVAVLTESNVPGLVASGIAGAEVLILKPFRDWRKNRKDKTSD